MFDNIQQKSGWDMSQDMVWGYFFTHSTRAPLERAARLLQAQGYRLEDIHLADKDSPKDPDQWWLHLEKVKTHSVASLNARNLQLNRFADENGLDTYDGMDVGPVQQ